MNLALSFVVLKEVRYKRSNLALFGSDVALAKLKKACMDPTNVSFGKSFLVRSSYNNRLRGISCFIYA